jgi:hypothetical protein
MTPDRINSLSEKQELTPEFITEILKKRGWEVKTMTKEQAGLIPLDQNGAVGCIDGREIEAEDETIQNAYARGPKVPGGIIGVALILWKDGTALGIARACKSVRNKMFSPGVHDVVENHCGAKKLAEEGKYEQIGLPTLTADAQRIVQIIQQQNGIFVHHMGNHEEQGMIFNYDPTMTRCSDGRYFQADLAWLVSLGVDPKSAIEFYALTVEQLKPDAKTAYIVNN